jgi:orotate phosphoribosyltransferase
MDPITQFIERLLFSVMIVIIGIEGVFSLLDRFGFLPRFLEVAYLARERRLVTSTLEEMGLVDKKPLIRQSIDYWRAETLAAIFDAKSALEELIRPNTRELGRESRSGVGLYKKIRLKYYIDLADYASDWEKLDFLVHIMCSNIKKALASLDAPIQIDKMAAPPGNPALAVITAAQMRKPFIAVTPVSPLASDPISGKIEKGEHVALIHDVVLTGYRLEAVANALRTAGATVEHAFVLVERTDSKGTNGETPSEALARNGIKLHPVISLGDDELASLLKERNSKRQEQSAEF